MSDSEHHLQMDRIRAGLRDLRARGVSVPERPVDEQAVVAFENRVGSRIPGELRSFMTSIGIGGEGPGHGLMPIDAWGEAILEPSNDIFALECPLDPARGYGDYAEVVDPAQGAIAIASDGAGAPYTLLLLSGPNRGRLARYDPDSESCVWLERAWPVEPLGFLDYYEGWIDLRLAGGVTTFNGSGLIGEESQLLHALLETTLPDWQRARACAGLSALPSLTSRVRSTLLQAYADMPPVVRAALVPLVAGGTSAEAIAWADLLGDPSPAVRRAAIRHLRSHPEPAALTAVATRADDPDDVVAEAALMAIARTPHLSIDVLARAFERPRLRVLVASELARLPSRAALALLVRALHDDDANVRRVAAFSLESSDPREHAIAPLERALETESEPTVRNAIERTLGKLQSRR